MILPLYFQATAILYQVEQHFDSSINPILTYLQEQCTDVQAVFTAEISIKIVNMWRTAVRMEEKQHLWEHMESTLDVQLQKYVGTMYVTKIYSHPEYT